jgi:hypothetical protein
MGIASDLPRPHGRVRTAGSYLNRVGAGCEADGGSHALAALPSFRCSASQRPLGRSAATPASPFDPTSRAALPSFRCSASERPLCRSAATSTSTPAGPPPSSVHRPPLRFVYSMRVLSLQGLREQHDADRLLENRQGSSHWDADAKSLFDEAIRRGMGGA